MKIAIIGPPGSGKTTMAAGLFYKLKKLNKKVELVPELIKYKVYKNEDFSKPGFDISNTLEQQLFESQFKKENFDFLICEAPLCNGYFYSSFYKKKEESKILKKIALNAINDYDIVLFHKMLPNKIYSTFGRKESEEESINFASWIEQKFRGLGFKGRVLITDQDTNINELIKKFNTKQNTR